MWIMWFIRRFPARESRCRTISPDEASMGAVPVHEAYRFRSVNRATSPVSASTRAATTGPTPGRSIRVEPDARTIALSSLVRALAFFSITTSSAISSAASRRRVLPATSLGLTVARMALAWLVLIFFDCPGTSSARSRWTRLTHWIRARVSSARRSTSNRSASSWVSWARTRRFLVRAATTATAWAS